MSNESNTVVLNTDVNFLSQESIIDNTSEPEPEVSNQNSNSRKGTASGSFKTESPKTSTLISRAVTLHVVNNVLQ